MAGDTKTDFSAVSKSNNQDIDGILYGQKWSGDALTFSFPDTIDEYTGFAYQGFSAFSKEAQAAAKAALDVFSSVTDLTFTNIDETTTVHANLRFANSDDAKNNPTARGTLPGTSTGGDMYFNSTANPGYADPKLGSYDYYVTLHELGHALGLTHGHDDGLSGHPYGFLPHDHNSSEYSIMTYRSFPDAPQDNNIYARAGNFPQSLMQDDIAALQYMYGANFDHNSGDTVYTFDAKTGEMFVDDAGQGAPAANIIFRTVWDGGGEDTYDLSNYTTDLTIDLNPGASSVFSTAQLANLDTQSNKHHAAGNVYNALLYNNDTSSLIENAIGGSGNDKITGNQVDNKLDGMGGNDMLFGGDGNDRLDGGGGINVLDGGNGSDIAVFDHSGYYYTRAFNKADGSIKFTGNGEAAGEIDTVKNTENYAFDGLPNGITNAFAPKGTNTLPRNDDGYSSPIDVSGVFLNGLNFYGNHFDNIYVNNNGNITFTNGLSTYTPGSIGGGSNAIIAPFWGDVDTRPSDGGFVYYNADPTHGTFTATWQNVGYYGSHTDKLNSFQVELVDEGSGDFEIIFRYSNINWLTGDASGGSGGLGGSIARAGFSAGDNVYGHYFELPQSGNSAGMLNLESTAGNTGSAGAWVFRVSNGVVDGIGGAMDDVLNGNDKNNSIYGFGGNDTIDGKGGNDTLYGGDGNDTIIGGAGNDKMYGGTGDDTYIVSDPGDKVFESKGEGNDTVQAAINYVLPMGSISEVENLVLIGNALNGTGNELNNNIIGNNLDNTINGGAGNDTLDGGTGNDKINGQDGNDILLGGAGNDKYDGGNGFDEVVFNTQVTIDLATPANNTGDAKGDSYVNIELFVGSNSDDRFVGGNGADGFFGGAGNDIIYGNGGNDGLEGGAGADQLNGGPGVNQVTYQHSAQGVTVLLQDNNPAIVSGGDADGDLVLNFQNVTGSQSNDVLGSNAQANILEGLGGDDILKAGAAIGPADTFDGGTGSDTMDYSLAGPTGITITLDKNGNATGVGGLAAGDTLISIENLIGGGGNDVLSGNASANVINGGGGSDTIKGGGGGDTLDGGDGIDTISYAWVAANQEVFVTLGEPGVSKAGGTFPGDNLVNFENIIGHAGYDVLGGNSLANIINGGGGDDIIIGGAGADTLIGGTGNDTVAYVDAGAAVTVNLKLLGGQLGQGLPGEDSFGDVLSGFENITGSKHDDNLTGDNNNNVIEGGAGADIMGGGLGSDTLSYQFSSMAVTVTLMGSNAADVHGGDAEGDTALNFENIKGSGFNDILGGDLNVNTLDGFSGLDTADYSNSAAAIQITLDSLGNATGIGGLAAGDHLISIENLTGGAGNDTLTGNDFVNVLMGGGGDDLLVGNGGGDTLDGGQGFDTVSYAGSGQPVIVTLGIAGAETTGINGDAAGDKISNVENITGSAFGDILSGNEQANVIHGGGGDDFIEGGAGSDILTGDGGIDTISYAHSTDGVTINLKLAGPQAVGGDGTGDTLSGFESILGSDHDDNLTGSAGNNTIEGGAGADTLSGGGGVDTLSYNRSSASVSVTLHGSSQADTSGGDAQGDIVVGFMNVTGSSHDDILTGDNNVNVIKGGAGSDTITGGLGADILTGGNPNDGISDTFVYNALAEKGDHITDFVGGVDVIAINAAGFGIAGAADFSSSATPTPPAGNATFLYDTDNGNLFFDDDGTGAHARVLLLTLDGHPSLAQGDIHLV